MNIEELGNFETLLHDFEETPRSNESQSIFDVAGYPHYENVCSNLMAFYLDPSEEHGLGSLYLSSILEAAGSEMVLSDDAVEVEREVTTIGRGRLDILVKCDGLVLGIENKVFHHVANDLEDYARTASSVAADCDVLLVLLSTRREREHAGFKSVTYSDLNRILRSRMGAHVSTASQKWLLYLADFLASTDRLAGGSMKLDAQDKFIVENHERISRLLEARARFQKKLATRVQRLMAMCTEQTGYIKQWIHIKRILVHDFEVNGHRIAFDFEATPKSWELLVFGRDQASREFLEGVLAREVRHDEAVKVGSKWRVLELPIEAELEAVKEELLRWMNRIVSAARTTAAN